MSKHSHPFQMNLAGFNGNLWLPNAAGDGSAGLGPVWAVGGTPTQPAPTSTNVSTMLRRTKFSNVGPGPADQEVGPRMSNAADFRYFWNTTGNTNRLGGFYFSATFTIEKWLANTGRLFVGLASSAAGAVVTNNAPVQPCMGLWHKTTHGANELYIMGYDGAALGETLIAPPVGNARTILAAGSSFRWEMFAEGAAQHVGWTLSAVGQTASQANCSTTGNATLTTTGNFNTSGFSIGGTLTTGGTLGIVAGTTVLAVAADGLTLTMSANAGTGTGTATFESKVWSRCAWGELQAANNGIKTALLAPACQVSNGANVAAADDFAISGANVLVTAEPTLT